MLDVSTYLISRAVFVSVHKFPWPSLPWHGSTDLCHTKMHGFFCTDMGARENPEAACDDVHPFTSLKYIDRLITVTVNTRSLLYLQGAYDQFITLRSE